MRLFIRGLEIYTSCRDVDTDILIGRRNTTIYVTQEAYDNMSVKFSAECKTRCIEVRIFNE